MDDDQSSERVVLQRLRNRAIEALEDLADGDDGVSRLGMGDYVNGFFDTIDDDMPWRWREWSTLTPAEVTALDGVQRVLLDACAETTRVYADEEFIALGGRSESSRSGPQHWN